MVTWDGMVKEPRMVGYCLGWICGELMGQWCHVVNHLMVHQPQGSNYFKNSGYYIFCMCSVILSDCNSIFQLKFQHLTKMVKQVKSWKLEFDLGLDVSRGIARVGTY
jgi:hypothetical protein